MNSKVGKREDHHRNSNMKRGPISITNYVSSAAPYSATRS